MVLTAENYYSKEANKEYMSVSQYKDFAGTYGKMACEFSAVEKLEERWAQKKTTPLLVGSYVDSYFEGTLEEFKKENPEIFTQKGDLKANYKQAERIIARMERDPLFMQYMSGEKQVIMTGELFGAEWKIKIDSFVRGIAITDLKVMASITKLEWVKDIGYLDFVRYWGYDIQGAIYQEIAYQNTGERLPFYIAAGTKEEEPNHMYKVEKKNRVLRIPDEKFDEYKKMGYIIRDENDNVLFEPENIKATAEKLKKENDELKAKLEEATLYAENADKKIAELQKENDKLKAAVQAQSATGDADPAETEKKTAAKGSKKTE